MSYAGDSTPWLGHAPLKRLRDLARRQCFQDLMDLITQDFGLAWPTLDSLLADTQYTLCDKKWFVDFLVSNVPGARWAGRAGQYYPALLNLLRRQGLSQAAFLSLWARRPLSPADPLLRGRTLAQALTSFPDTFPSLAPGLDPPTLKGLLLELCRLHPQGHSLIDHYKGQVNSFFYLRYCAAKYMAWPVIQREVVPALVALLAADDGRACPGGGCGFRDTGCRPSCDFVSLLVAVMVRGPRFCGWVSGHVDFQARHVPMVLRELKGVMRTQALPVVHRLARVYMEDREVMEPEMLVTLLGFVDADNPRSALHLYLYLAQFIQEVPKIRKRLDLMLTEALRGHNLPLARALQETLEKWDLENSPVNFQS